MPKGLLTLLPKPYLETDVQGENFGLKLIRRNILIGIMGKDLSLKALSLRLPEDLLNEIKSWQDVSYQSLLKMF